VKDNPPANAGGLLFKRIGLNTLKLIEKNKLNFEYKIILDFYPQKRVNFIIALVGLHAGVFRLRIIMTARLLFTSFRLKPDGNST